MQPTRDANLTSIRRDAWIEVDLNSLEHNLAVLREGLVQSALPPQSGSEPVYLSLNAPVNKSVNQSINRPGGKETGKSPPQLMAVVKGDAYGHGAVQLSQLFAATHVELPWGWPPLTKAGG